MANCTCNIAGREAIGGDVDKGRGECATEGHGEQTSVILALNLNPTPPPQASAVTCMDWDEEGRFLRSNNLAGDLDFWECTSGGYALLGGMFGGGGGGGEALGADAKEEQKTPGVSRVRRYTLHPEPFTMHPQP